MSNNENLNEDSLKSKIGNFALQSAGAVGTKAKEILSAAPDAARAVAQKTGLYKSWKPGESAGKYGSGADDVFTGAVVGNKPVTASPGTLSHAQAVATKQEHEIANAARVNRANQEVANKELLKAQQRSAREEGRLKASQEAGEDIATTPVKPITPAKKPGEGVNVLSGALNVATVGGIGAMAAQKSEKQTVTPKTLGGTAAQSAPENKTVTPPAPQRQTPPAAPPAAPTPTDITPKSVKSVPVKPDGSVVTPEPPKSVTPPTSSSDDDTVEFGAPKKVKAIKIGPNGNIQEQQAPVENDRNRGWRLPKNMFDPTPMEKQNVPNTPATYEPPGGPIEPKKVQTIPVAPAPTAAAPAKPAEKSAAAPAKPAATPKAEAPKAEEPAAPKSRAMYQQATDMANRGENDTAAYWRAVAQHEKEQGRTAPNDFSDSSVGKFFSGLFGGKKVDEATKYLSMNPSSTNMFAEAKKLKGDQYKLDKNKNGKLDSQDFKMLRGEKMEEETDFSKTPDSWRKASDGEYNPRSAQSAYDAGKKRATAGKPREETSDRYGPYDKHYHQGYNSVKEEVINEKKADKDYDGDGKVESSKDEVWGSRLKAAKKAGKLEEGSLKSKIIGVITGAGKKPEIELLNDPFRKSAYPPKMSTGEKAAIGAGAAAVGAVAAGESKKEEPKTIQQSNNPTPRSATDRIRDNLGLDSPDYSPKKDPDYKPKDDYSPEDKEELNKKFKDAIKENYLNILKRK
jgi:hypothetical protein